MNLPKALIIILFVIIYSTLATAVFATTYPSPAPAGCTWARVDCVQAPCDQPPYVLVCASPTPKPVKPSPTPIQISTCDNLEITGGNNSSVPAAVTMLAKAADNKGSIQKYQFYFGDGQKVETTDRQVTHEYQASGSFTAIVYAQDSTGKWITSNRCEAKVHVKANNIESHKANCSDLFLTVDNAGRAPAVVTARVTGFDNKGNLKRYKVDFGKGVVREGESNTFSHTFTTAGTYTIEAAVQDSTDYWRIGDGACKKTITITDKPLTTQPKTGSETWYALSGIAATIGGIGTWILKKRGLLG